MSKKMFRVRDFEHDVHNIEASTFHELRESILRRFEIPASTKIKIKCGNKVIAQDKDLAECGNRELTVIKSSEQTSTSIGTMNVNAPDGGTALGVNHGIVKLERNGARNTQFNTSDQPVKQVQKGESKESKPPASVQPQSTTYDPFRPIQVDEDEDLT